MRTLARILCAIDLEKASERAFDRALSLAVLGNAKLFILHANTRKVDIVVLGSNRRRGWRRLREGSVAERVLRRAAWPVLVVPWDAPRTGVLDRHRARGSSKSRPAG